MNLIKNFFLKIMNFFKIKRKNKDFKRNHQTNKNTFHTSNNHNQQIELIIIDRLRNSDRYIGSKDLIAEINRKLNIKLSAPFLRKIIANLRIKGNAIVANNKGYFLSNDKKEINNYIQSRMKEINMEIEVLNGFKY